MIKAKLSDYPRTLGAIDLLNFDEPLQLRLKARLAQFVNEDLKTPFQTLFTSANVIGAVSTLNNLQSIFDYEHRMITQSLGEMHDESDTIEVFEYQEPEPCRTCAGTGIGQYGDPNTSNCRDCKGTGEEQDPEPSDWGES